MTRNLPVGWTHFLCEPFAACFTNPALRSRCSSSRILGGTPYGTTRGVTVKVGGRSVLEAGRWRRQRTRSRDSSASEPDRLREPDVLRSLGIVAYRQKNYEGALGFLNHSLHLHRARGEPHLEALDLTQMGWAYESQGRYQEALKSYEEALPLARAAGTDGDPGLVLHGLGSMHMGLGDYRLARGFLQEALALRQQYGIPHTENTTRFRLAQTEQALGNLEAARGSVTVKANPATLPNDQRIQAFLDATVRNQALTGGTLTLLTTGTPACNYTSRLARSICGANPRRRAPCSRSSIAMTPTTSPHARPSTRSKPGGPSRC